MTVQEIETRCKEIFSKVNLEFNGITIFINGRLTKTLGRCCYKVSCGKVIPVRLEFSRQLLETATPQSIDSVILHEAAHAIACIETGESQGHNAYFKKVCVRIGTDNDKTKTQVSRVVDDSQIYKYLITCSCCKEIVGKYQRAGKVIKNISYYRCPFCKSSLEIKQNF